MPLDTTGSVGVEIPNDAQVRWGIADSLYDENGKYGPCFELDLEALNDEYLGARAKAWPRIQEPRLDIVRRLRKDDLPDEAIEAALRKKGFKFADIDEPDRRVISRKGGTYKILVAVCGGDHRKAEQVLKECNSFDDLADFLKGGSFVIATKVTDEGYPRIDLREDVFPDLESQAAKEVRTETETELDELPDDDPPPAF